MDHSTPCHDGNRQGSGEGLFEPRGEERKKGYQEGDGNGENLTDQATSGLGRGCLRQAELETDKGCRGKRKT